MKKTIIALMITAAFLAGCSSDKSVSATADPAQAETEIKAEPKAETETETEKISVVSEISGTAEDTEAPAVEETSGAEETSEAGETPEVEEMAEEVAETPAAEISKTEVSSEKTVSKPKAIVWLGDSLTQGSLGDKDDNLANAPYVRLQKKVDVPVEGYGFYGYNTHDIFWVYTDETQLAQQIDPAKVYIVWVGSCDWAPSEGPNANTAPVIKQIDDFLAHNGGVKNYIVIGTTSRLRLGDLYIPINNDLKAHYGIHYMDCIDIINKFGYSEDRTHLSQASYDSIADAVYDKLKALGYI